MPVIGASGEVINVAVAPSSSVTVPVASTPRVLVPVAQPVSMSVGGGDGSALILAAERSIGEGDATLAYTDGVIGGGGNLALPPHANSDATQAFIISAYMGPITVTPDGDDLLFDVTNTPVPSLTVAADTAIELLHYAGVWRVIFDSGSAGGGTSASIPAASVVLYCPTLTGPGESGPLTPVDGDEMYWVEHTPGLTTPDPMTGLSDWTGREAFTWTEGWSTANDPTNVLILTSEQSWLPTVLAEVTPFGFTAIPVLGGQPILLGCGGSPDFTGSVWNGWNIGDGTQGGGIDPTLPALLITPTGTLADWVRIVDRSGNGQHTTLAEWARWNGTRYYENTIAVQPWAQDGADFGVSATVTAHGHVTRTSTWVAHATITFSSTVDVVTPGTGTPLFYAREFLRSFDPAFSGWYWGWNNPDARCPVNGQVGGLPFVGFVDRDGLILDANGDPLVRALQTGDWLTGTVTGVFQND